VATSEDIKLAVDKSFTIERNASVVDLIVVLVAKHADDVAELRELVPTQVRMSREEPGCLQFDSYESQSALGTFFVVEQWESQAALDQHRQAKAITTVYVPRILPLVDRHLHVCSALPGRSVFGP
jgi:quinol monooxygenase YgiN